MEKLIELLNEYVEETDFWDNLDEYNEVEILDEETLEVNWKYHDIEYLYTKKFWFIKWLVDNDKIDTDVYKTVYSGDLDKRKTLTMSSGWDEFYQVTEHWVYESLLMLLAIQDEPIDFLISILK